MRKFGGRESSRKQGSPKSLTQDRLLPALNLSPCGGYGFKLLTRKAKTERREQREVLTWGNEGGRLLARGGGGFPPCLSCWKRKKGKKTNGGHGAAVHGRASRKLAAYGLSLSLSLRLPGKLEKEVQRREIAREDNGRRERE